MGLGRHTWRGARAALVLPTRLRRRAETHHERLDSLPMHLKFTFTWRQYETVLQCSYPIERIF